MNEMQATLDRLESRLDDQDARIQALYEVLGRRGILPRRATRAGDAFTEEISELERAPSAHRRATRLHVGTATGV